MTLRKSLFRIIAAALSLSSGGCFEESGPSPIIGTWLVHDSKAPFPMHLYVFNDDGTMQQASPDAGDANGSASDGKGVWTVSGSRIRGKWVEIMADRGTRQYTGRGEYSFEIQESGDRLSGNGKMNLFDATGRPTAAITTTFTGERVTLHD